MLTNLHFELRGFIENLFYPSSMVTIEYLLFSFTVDPTRTA